LTACYGAYTDTEHPCNVDLLTLSVPEKPTETPLTTDAEVPSPLQSEYGPDRKSNLLVDNPETLPVAPVIPVGPATPCTPCNPIGPTSPFGPIGPAGPTKPIGPTAPTSPFGPCGPGPPSEDERSDVVHFVAALIAPDFLFIQTLIISPAGIVGAVVVVVVVSSALALPKPNDPIIIPIERMEIVCRFARVVVFMPLT
jgi:hypothetical protein